jgi:hypothetical protein
VDEAQTPIVAVSKCYVFKINNLKLGTDAAMTVIQADSLAALENFR